MITDETSSPAPQRLESPQSRGGKKRRLRTIVNVRSFVAHVLRELEADRMDADKARALLFGAKILADLIKDGDLEERIAALEASGVQGAVQAELSNALLRLKQALPPEQYKAALLAIIGDGGEGAGGGAQRARRTAP